MLPPASQQQRAKVLGSDILFCSVFWATWGRIHLNKIKFYSLLALDELTDPAGECLKNHLNSLTHFWHLIQSYSFYWASHFSYILAGEWVLIHLFPVFMLSWCTSPREETHVLSALRGLCTTGSRFPWTHFGGGWTSRLAQSPLSCSKGFFFSS